MGCAKFCLGIINALLLLIGLIPLATGIVVMLKPDAVTFVLNKLMIATDSINQVDGNYLGDLTTTIKTGAWILVIGGAFISLVGFFGCCGACLEKKAYLILYSIVLIALILAEVSFVIFAFIYPSKIEQPVKEGLYNSLNHFKADMPNVTDLREPNKSFTLLWHIVQVSMRCCGINNYTDYSNITWIGSEFGIPKSCCKKATKNYQLNDFENIVECRKPKENIKYINTKSCFMSFKDEVNKYKFLIIGCMVSLILLEFSLLGMTIAVMKGPSKKRA